MKRLVLSKEMLKAIDDATTGCMKFDINMLDAHHYSVGRPLLFAKRNRTDRF
jgi:hypothetical protein